MKRLVKQMVMGIWRRLVPRGARNSLRLCLMLEMPDRAPRLVEGFGGPVVVLAPHMDDEIIGPGGTICRHVVARAGVTFVFMTDGRSGDPEVLRSGLAKSEIDRLTLELAGQRKAESRRAAEMIGVDDLVFLDGPDGRLSESTAIVDALAAKLREKQPAVIYAPAITDNHRDHWATNRILRLALQALPTEMRAGIVIRGYEVWTPCPANVMVDITEVADAKKHAIGAFTTQTKFVDYAWTAMGLNQYRSMVHLHGHGFAEAFFETTVEEYLKAFEVVELARGHENMPVVLGQK